MPASTPAQPDPETYMEAFMNGFDFVLLAMRGRLSEAELPAAERARIEGFLADYSRIARAYRDRKQVRDERLVVRGPIVADLAQLATN